MSFYPHNLKRTFIYLPIYTDEYIHNRIKKKEELAYKTSLDMKETLTYFQLEFNQLFKASIKSPGQVKQFKLLNVSMVTL